MNKYIGIKVIEKGSNDLTTFSIIQSEKSQAIETLINCMKSGHVVTLADNRDNRCGSVSIKFENGEFYTSGGGHEFSIDWKQITEKDSVWLIKSVAIFNNGIDDFSTGIIK